MSSAFASIKAQKPKWCMIKITSTPPPPSSSIPLSLSNLMDLFRDPTNKYKYTSLIFHPLLFFFFFFTIMVVHDACCSCFFHLAIYLGDVSMSHLENFIMFFCYSYVVFHRVAKWVYHYMTSPLLIDVWVASNILLSQTKLQCILSFSLWIALTNSPVEWMDKGN